MHAVLVNVTISDRDAAERELKERVVPTVSQAPGLVAGYWLRGDGDKGWSIVVFESEEQARAAADQIRPPEGVTLDRLDVREVVAHT